jgi:hypothetical protein
MNCLIVKNQFHGVAIGPRGIGYISGNIIEGNGHEGILNKLKTLILSSNPRASFQIFCCFLLHTNLHRMKDPINIDGNTIRDHTGPGVYAINFDKQSTKENTVFMDSINEDETQQYSRHPIITSIPTIFGTKSMTDTVSII